MSHQNCPSEGFVSHLNEGEHFILEAGKYYFLARQKTYEYGCNCEQALKILKSAVST